MTITNLKNIANQCFAVDFNGGPTCETEGFGGPKVGIHASSALNFTLSGPGGVK